LSTICRVRHDFHWSDLRVIGIGEAGLPTLLACALAPSIGRVAIDTNGFPNEDDQAYVDGLFAPGLRRAGDLRTAAMLIAPKPLCLFNTGDIFKTDRIAAGFESVRAPIYLERGP